MSNDTRKVGEEAGGIPDPVVHNVDRVMDDLYFKDGSIRERIASIETTLRHHNFYFWFLCLVAIAILGGVGKLVFSP